MFARSSGIGTEQALQVVRKKCTARGCVVVQKNDFGEFLFEQKNMLKNLPMRGAKFNMKLTSRNGL